MIEISNITKKYVNGKESCTALDNVSFHIKRGDFVVIDGPSGAGKSTLLYSIGGLIHPDSGQILFENENIYEKPGSFLNDYRKLKVGFMFQQFHLMPYLTVLENIRLGCHKNLNYTAINDYVMRCSLDSLKNKYPSQLSVGEKQRTAFIRAIICGPVVLLADEPTGNLDPGNSKVLMVLLEEFHKKGGTVIVVSHDPLVAASAHTRISLEKGRIINKSGF
jgi:putative ABC transport system ATP-binding protein